MSMIEKQVLRFGEIHDLQELELKKTEIIKVKENINRLMGELRKTHEQLIKELNLDEKRAERIREIGINEMTLRLRTLEAYEQKIEKEILKKNYRSQNQSKVITQLA